MATTVTPTLSPPPRPLRASLRMLGDGLAGALANGGALLAYPLARRRLDRWGATDEEVAMALPFEAAADRPMRTVTHGITVAAPPERIWPWLLQIGQNRGGFYSYELLENVVGCRMRNVEGLEPRLQIARVGDPVTFHPRQPPVPVTALDPGRTLVIGGWWTFHLAPRPDGTTRLIVRTSYPMAGSRLGRLAQRALLDPVHFVMERKMLLELKRLAER